MEYDILVVDTQLIALHSGFSSCFDLVEAKVILIEVLLKEGDAQQVMVKAFRSSLNVANADHYRILGSIFVACDAWENVLQKREVYVRQKSGFSRHFEVV